MPRHPGRATESDSASAPISNRRINNKRQGTTENEATAQTQQTTESQNRPIRSERRSTQLPINIACPCCRQRAQPSANDSA